MYIPAHFQPPDDDAVLQLLVGGAAADLITATERGLLATLLPLLYLPPDRSGPDRPHGALLGHLARTNEQWSLAALGESMAILRGEDAYITPSWYASKADHGRVVPTWNYVTAHVYGELIVHDDPAWVEQLVRALTTAYEQGRPQPWSVDDAPAPYIRGQLRAIVGLELVITRVEAKFKLSQNRSTADIDGVIAGLAGDGRDVFAAAMAGANTGKLGEREAQ